jgi:hypothetical protein
MAQNLHINILAKDRTKAALGSVQRGLGNLRNSLFSIQSALVGIGGALVVRSFIRVGAEVENLKVRFAFLFKGMEEGNKAFTTLIDFAAKVPFSLEEISAASGNLAVVSKDSKELAKILQVTGNVATVTGLDFAMTATQIQRSFAGGIAAADVFREKGVRALLGFEAGAKKTAKETKEAFFRVFGPDGEFGKAMEVMAVTFTGTLSMLGDKLFKFKLQTNEAGFFDFIKSGLAVVNNLIEDNDEILTQFATRLSNALIVITKNVLLGTAQIIDLLRPVFAFVGTAIANLFNVLRMMPAGIRELGIIGFLMLGGKGKLIVLVIAGAIDKIRSLLAELIDGFAFAQEKLAKAMRFLKLISEETLQANLKTFQEMRDVAEDFRRPLKDIADEYAESADNAKELGKATEAVQKFLSMVEDHMFVSNEQMKKLLELAGKVKNETKEIGFQFSNVAETLNQKMKKDFESINQTIGNIVHQGIKGFSRALAEAVVLGKDLKQSFEELAKRLLVEILAFGIQIVIQEQLRNFLIDKGILSQENQKRTMSQILGINVADLLIHKKKTEEIKEQNKELRSQNKQNFIKTLFAFAGGGMASGGTVAQGKPYVVGERGPELFIPNTQGQISQNARGMGGKSVNVNFNINTIDSRGFEDALNENRGTITAIINNAVNEKGRGDLV